MVPNCRIGEFSASIAVDGQYKAPGAAVVPMFAQINALPGTQIGPTATDREGNGRAQERGFDVCRHIVRSFVRVNVVGRIFRYHFIEMTFEIGADARIGILIDGEGGGRMLDKQLTNTLIYRAAAEYLLHIVRDQVEPSRVCR